jgi:hypothetical protein
MIVQVGGGGSAARPLRGVVAFALQQPAVHGGRTAARGATGRLPGSLLVAGALAGAGAFRRTGGLQPLPPQGLPPRPTPHTPSLRTSPLRPPRARCWATWRDSSASTPPSARRACPTSTRTRRRWGRGSAGGRCSARSTSTSWPTHGPCQRGGARGGLTYDGGFGGCQGGALVVRPCPKHGESPRRSRRIPQRPGKTAGSPRCCSATASISRTSGWRRGVPRGRPTSTHATPRACATWCSRDRGRAGSADGTRCNNAHGFRLLPIRIACQSRNSARQHPSPNSFLTTCEDILHPFLFYLRARRKSGSSKPPLPQGQCN